MNEATVRPADDSWRLSRWVAVQYALFQALWMLFDVSGRCRQIALHASTPKGQDDDSSSTSSTSSNLGPTWCVVQVNRQRLFEQCAAPGPRANQSGKVPTVLAQFYAQGSQPRLFLILHLPFIVVVLLEGISGLRSLVQTVSRTIRANTYIS